MNKDTSGTLLARTSGAAPCFKSSVAPSSLSSELLVTEHIHRGQLTAGQPNVGIGAGTTVTSPPPKKTSLPPCHCSRPETLDPRL